MRYLLHEGKLYIHAQDMVETIEAWELACRRLNKIDEAEAFRKFSVTIIKENEKMLPRLKKQAAKNISDLLETFRRIV